jgi:Zn finger protein HypA/HybF involved in hydrogenase expression
MTRILLFKIPDKEDPHVSGKARCMTCQHEWVAVAPIGTDWLECPKCGGMKGFFKFQCEQEGEHWRCKCGSWLFAITQNGVYCPNCAAEHEDFM